MALYPRQNSTFTCYVQVLLSTLGFHNATLEFYFRHWSFTMRHWSFTFDILVTLFNIYFSFATYDHVNSNNKNTVSRCKMVVFQAPFVFHVFNSTTFYQIWFLASEFPETVHVLYVLQLVVFLIFNMNRRVTG